MPLKSSFLDSSIHEILEHFMYRPITDLDILLAELFSILHTLLLLMFI